MAYQPYLGNELPNIVNITKRMDPDGTIAAIAELLAQFNPILEDIPVVEANLPTGHRVTVRSDIPKPTWRRLNYGVRSIKFKTTQVEDTIGMLEDWGEVDKDVADLNGNTAEFRLSEDEPHIEGMSNDMATTLFYGDTSVYPDRFLGLAPRYNQIGQPADKPTAILQSDYLHHVIDAGGTNDGNLTSIWYIMWGPSTVFGIYPKGSSAGLMSEDLGLVTLYDNDGGRFRGYQTHYQWKMGLCVKDWRYIVRVANVDLSLMEDEAAQKALYHAMIKARHTVPQTNRGNGVFYSSAGVQAMLDIAATEKTNAALGYTNIFGQDMLTFRGVPVKACNSILETEAQLA